MRIFSTRQLLPLVGALAAVTLSADTIVLKNGDRIVGSYLGGTTRQVRLDTPGGIQAIEVERIQSIQFDEVAAPAPAPRARVDLTPRYPQTAQAISGVTIPTDTVVSIRMIDSVDSERARLGQTFRASLDEPIVVNGEQVVPRNADVLCKLVDDQQAGRIQGRSSLTLALASIDIRGRMVDVTSTDVQTSGSSQGARTAKAAGGTAALGAIIGAIAGGGTGAAIGAASGAAVGTGAAVLTKGSQVKIPSETRLSFRLQQPVRI